MTFEDLRDRFRTRLDEGDRGDRGWFVITRVHVSVAWLKGIAEYLADQSGSKSIQLSPRDYQRLGVVIGSGSSDPGVQLRRHHLLVMERPLQLIQRVDERYWDEGIVLTELGQQLAETPDASEVLERTLRGIQFAIEPWCPPSRAAEYHDFAIPVFEATRQTLEACEGKIDRDEFDFFLSRVRTLEEVSWAIELIHAYRLLTAEEQDALHSEVQARVPGEKVYQNWRDVALHTFSLFSLGTSMLRRGHDLVLTREWNRCVVGTAGGPESVSRELRMPTIPESEDLLAPPADPESNSGAAAESFVAKVLRADGWEVAFYTNRRGYGFDLWARRGSSAMVVEVKSSLGALGAVSLTPVELKAASGYGDNYVLALVERVGSDEPELRLVQNPLSKVSVQEVQSTRYVIARAQWEAAAD